MPYDATGEFYRANLAVFPLGGNFNSRINQNLREDKGYTYGARAYETPAQKAGLLSQNLTYDLDVDFVDRQKATLESLTTATSQEVAGRHLSLDDMILIVVGDKGAVWPGIEALCFPIVELDAVATPEAVVSRE